MHDHEVIEERGNYRAGLVNDTYPEAPDYDGQGYVFHVSTVASLEHMDYGDEHPSFELNELLNHTDCDWDLIERYLRIFHDVVAFERGMDGGYRSGNELVIVVTRAQRDKWGCPEDATNADLTEGTLKTWQAYYAGDTWGAVIEERTVTEVRTLDGHVLTTDESWTEVDSCWGYYGDEYAREEALSMLSGHVQASTCRHCGRRILNIEGLWIDPEATGDDAVWRETCDSHDTLAAEHEPTEPELGQAAGQ